MAASERQSVQAGEANYALPARFLAPDAYGRTMPVAHPPTRDEHNALMHFTRKAWAINSQALAPDEIGEWRGPRFVGLHVMIEPPGHAFAPNASYAVCYHGPGEGVLQIGYEDMMRRRFMARHLPLILHHELQHVADADALTAPGLKALATIIGCCKRLRSSDRLQKRLPERFGPPIAFNSEITQFVYHGLGGRLAPLFDLIDQTPHESAETLAEHYQRHPDAKQALIRLMPPDKTDDARRFAGQLTALQTEPTHFHPLRPIPETTRFVEIGLPPIPPQLGGKDANISPKISEERRYFAPERMLERSFIRHVAQYDARKLHRFVRQFMPANEYLADANGAKFADNAVLNRAIGNLRAEAQQAISASLLAKSEPEPFWEQISETHPSPGRRALALVRIKRQREREGKDMQRG